ncbi:hypothetical protein LZ198_34145 [Myxococcus sp. K15C18031901]|uniref:hypothetical protein n=1 Tax=Myxococcus dinghuensis TaxID=2906761 RepID=UPI0020A80226|nr:hypothetical protein [Myxococcus dinghuensis]MCP3103930.1 hypothetical protein [Myxococcus dinghuensis]
MMSSRLPPCLRPLCLVLGLSLPAAAQTSAATPELPPVAPTAPPEVTPPSEPPPPIPRAIPDVRVYLSSLNVFRYNPLGLESQNRLVAQKRLFDSPSVLLRDTFVNAALSLKLSPASYKIGPTVDIQPLAVLNVRAGYEYMQFFGTMGFLQSFPDAFRDFSDDIRQDGEDGAYSTTGHHFFIEPTLQAKVRSIALRTKFAIEYWNVDLRDGGTTFYEATPDTLVPGKGWLFANDTDLIWLGTQWTVGLRYSAVWPRYDEAQGVPEGTSANNSHMRVGPLVAYAFNTDEGTRFNRPTVLANVAWYLKHPNREEALPYLLVGFAFNSDIVSSR